MIWHDTIIERLGPCYPSPADIDVWGPLLGEGAAVALVLIDSACGCPTYAPEHEIDCWGRASRGLA